MSKRDSTRPGRKHPSIATWVRRVLRPHRAGVIDAKTCELPQRRREAHRADSAASLFVTLPVWLRVTPFSSRNQSQRTDRAWRVLHRLSRAAGLLVSEVRHFKQG